MKKFLTLVLALVLALAMTVPAMAFTDDTEADPASPASAFELDIFLVEYDDGIFGMSTYLPPADRGYAKNEIVAAVVELVVPKDTLAADLAGFTFEVSGENVKLLDETMQAGVATSVLDLGAGDDFLSVATIGDLENASTSKTLTFKWLVFAKVTGDDAILTAALSDTVNEGDLVDGDTVLFSVGDNDYEVDYDKDAGIYTIVPADFVVGDDFEGVEVSVSTKSSTKYDGKAISILYDTEEYTVGFYFNGKIFFKDSTGKIFDADSAAADEDIFEDLVDLYDDVVVEDLGLDAKKDGKVKPSYFEGRQSADSVEASVEIKPWTAYVTVPDNIVVDPPKTGDAASIVGFVMIVLAAAAVVAVKKVRA